MLSMLIVPFNNCSVYKSNSLDLSSQSHIDLESSLSVGKNLYNTNCSACHGSLEGSTKRNRSAVAISGAISNIAQMANLNRLTSAEIDLISQALGIAAVPTTVAAGRNVFTCNSNLVAKASSLKLSNREFKTALFSLLNDFSVNANTPLSADTQLNSLINSLPSDNLTANRFASKEQNFLITLNMSNGYFDAAFRAGLLASTQGALANYPNTSSCLNGAAITQSCHQSFVRELASRAFRKSLTVTEGNSLAANLWDTSLSKAELIQLTFTSIAQMPDFMYRTYDQGGASSRGARVLTMNAFELASKVSFFLVGKAPDTILRNLAVSGQILDKTILGQQVDRLLALPEAQDTIRRLFREAYGYDRFDNFSYSTEFLNGQGTSNLAAAMTQELDTFFTDTVLTRNGKFSDIMTSQNANITNSDLASIYGYSSAPGQTILPSNRAGFINRAAFLAKKSGNYTSPIKRGLAVLENILCDSVGAPPPNAPTSVPETQILNQYQSTRERYAHLSENPGSTCIFCHSRINSLGYTFEGFDSIGRARSVERIFTTNTGPSVATVPVLTQSLIPDLRATPTAINDSANLAADLATNDKAMLCFVKHIKDFESRTTATEADGCQMNQSLNTLYGTNGNQGSIQQAIKSLILADDFKLWSY